MCLLLVFVYSLQAWVYCWIKTKAMTRKEMRDFILSHGINNAIIVSSPDYKGGRYYNIILNTNEEDITLCDFEYIEGIFTSEELIRLRNEEFTMWEDNLTEKACPLWVLLQKAVNNL